jgi:hypothetical protein
MPDVERIVDFETALFFGDDSSIKVRITTKNLTPEKLEEVKKKFDELCKSIE